MASFGERLKGLREESKMFQKELAHHLNVSVSTINKYEYNQRTPSPDVIIKLADLFSVSTDYLLGRSDLKNPELYGFCDEAKKEVEIFIEFIKQKHKK